MRRTRVWLALLAALALLLAACDTADDPAVAPQEPDVADAETPDAETPADEPAEPDEPAEAPDAYTEAPMLAELVEAGELPPVEERLPDNPLVVTPNDSIGEYGGTWNSAMRGPSDVGWLYRNVGYEHLMHWDDDLINSHPNIAEDVEVNDDATEYVIHLREGMKWSDGEPFTAHDITFWYDDVASNEQLLGSVPHWLVTTEGPPTFEARDDHTLVVTFPSPYGAFLQWLAHPNGLPVSAHPRHYLEQFHADYNPDIEALVEESGHPDWAELFFEKSAESNPNMFDPDLPTLRPWQMMTRLGDGAQMVFERNPYYFKVDTEGQQLPYIDRVVFDVVDDEEVMVFKVINGEMDYHVHYGMSVANRPLIADHRESADYRFITEVAPFTLTHVIMLNLNHKDEVLRELFQNRDFRIGLSHAINRDEIISVVFAEQGEPMNPVEHPRDPLHDPEQAYQYTEYDVDLANEHLDAAGLTERDGAGYRLRPDGQRLSFQVDVALDTLQYWFDVMELIVPMWADVGVEIDINAVGRSLFSVRIEDNDHDASVWDGGGGLGTGYRFTPRHYFPFTAGNSHWAVEWSNWYQSEGREGEEPPESAQRQMELFDQFLATPDPDEQTEYYRQMLEIAKEEFWVIGISFKEDAYGIVRNNVHNVPDEVVGGYGYSSPGGPVPVEQMWIEQ